MTSSFSFHVIFDAVYQDLNSLRTALATLRPRVINIVGGARKSEAFTFAVEILKAYPAMRVIFRNFPDDGNHVKPQYALKWHRDAFGNLIVDDYSGCQKWIDDNYNYLLAGLTVLTDNESVNDNMDVYAAWQAKIMDLCGAKGFKVAVGRFAVGNPRESDYARMRVMWQALAKWHPLHVWSPNEYIPPDMKYAGGMINRYQQGIDAARKTEAFTFAVELLKTYPSMRVIFRSHPDDGNHVKERYALKWHRDTFGNLIIDDDSGCQKWIDDNYNYLLAGLTVLTDNESVNSQMDVYAAWQAKIMDLCGAKGFKVAVGRFAVGNPRESDYARMWVMWQALAKWHPLHVWSPNEYIPPDMKYAGGMINRYQQGIDAAKAINAWPFEVSIGEYGIVYRDAGGGLDANAGYRDNRIGWSGEKAFQYLYDQWVTWYKSNGVDVCVYCWGDDTSNAWSRFRVDTDNGFIKALLEANTQGKLEPVPTKPFLTPISKPADAASAIKIRVKNAEINVRSGPSTDYTKADILSAGDEITLYQTPFKQDKSGGVWRWVDISTALGGWVCTDVLSYVEIMPPVILPPPTPPATTYTVTLTAEEYAAWQAFKTAMERAAVQTVTAVVKAA